MHAIVVVFLTGITFTLAALNYKFPLDSSNYEFGYQVFDSVKGQDFGHSERRNLDRTDGTYYVLLPDGRKQTVTYFADSNGYFPIVTYEQVPIGNTEDPNIIFNPEGNIFREFKSESEYSSPQITNHNDLERPGLYNTPFKGVIPLKNSVGISTSNFDFHKNRKIDFVGSEVNNNKNSNSFSKFPTKLPVSFTNFAMNNLNSNKKLSHTIKDFNSFTRPGLKDNFETDFSIFGKPLKSVDSPTKVTYNPNLGRNNDAFRGESIFVNQLRQKPLILKESEQPEEPKFFNPTNVLTAIYIPSNDNSVSGYFRPLTNDMKITSHFSRIVSIPELREINSNKDTDPHKINPEDSVVPAFVPVPFPVEGDVVSPEENFTQFVDDSDDVSDNNLADYWDDDYL